MSVTQDRIIRRKKRVSLNMRGTKECPRVNVFRSSKYVYAQAIDDEARETIAGASSIKIKKSDTMTKGKQAKEVGIALAKLLLEKKVKKAIFDRGRYTYNGRIKALAEGLREGGIQV
jgi:large subunit ribosomal protein L18